MKSSRVLLLAIQAFGLVSANNSANCVADNCARAVTGTAKGTAHVATAKADCSSFMQQTVTIPASIATITDFVTVTTAPVVPKYRRDSQTVKPIPSYATACSGVDRYSSACSCWGVTATTTTVSGSVSTVTVSSTITVSGSSSGGSSASSSNSANPTYGTYEPAIPTSYNGCMLDPNSSATFQLLDADSGLPIVDNNGLASLGNNETSDPFHFSTPTNAPPGVFDMVLVTGGQSLYYAVFESGKIGFVADSSNGQTYVGTDPYVTSVFSVGCDGSVTAGIIGGTPFIFSVVDNNAVVTNLGAGSNNKVKRDIPVPPGYYVLPTTPPPSAKGSRCAGADQTAVSKVPSPAQSSNGCGSDTFPSKYAPNLWFKDCCNKHDICFNQCSSSFDDCNNAFATCNQNACDAIPFVFDPETGGDIQPGYLSCVLAAKLYSYAVTTSGGDDAIKSATADYCDCKCTDTTKTACGANCVDILTDPNNCGSCNFFCPSGGCTNGACSFNSCGGETCDTFGPCGPGGTCVCASITDNTGFCVDGTTPCDGLASCVNSSDCALGSVCAVGTCCGANVCIATDYCGGFGTGTKMLTRGFRGEGVWERGWVNGTISSKGSWVPNL